MTQAEIISALLVAVVPPVLLGVILRLTGRKPRPAEASVVTEYEPPDGLAPAELLTLLNVPGWAEAPGIATFVDLDSRGHITIEDLPEAERVTTRGALQRRWHVRRATGRDALRPFEKVALDRLFSQGEPAYLEIDTRIVTKKVAVQTTAYVDFMTLYRGLQEQGYMRGSGMPVRVFLSWIAAWGLVAVGVSRAWSVLDGPFSALALASGFALAACGFVIMSRLERGAHLTDKGKSARARTFGFRNYVGSVYGSRVDWGLREDVDEKLLAHAVAFGYGDRWHEGLAKRTA